MPYGKPDRLAPVKLLALLAGLIVLAFGVYLAMLLGSIRKRAYGAGRLLELPALGISLRYPGWWTLEAPGQAPPGETQLVMLRTGHRRGLFSIEALSPCLAEQAPNPIATQSSEGSLGVGRRGLVAGRLEAELLEIMHRRGIILDDANVRISPTAPGPDSGSALVCASVSSGGSRTAEPDQRTYFELHLVPVRGGLALFSYTNSVLQGFLDAFYIEKLLQTISPLGKPEGDPRGSMNALLDAPGPRKLPSSTDQDHLTRRPAAR